MKNLTGPPNSAIKSNSPGRIFITDGAGNVIADVTEGRAKQVVPGQGYVGSGDKKVPGGVPQGYLDLIKKVNPK